MNILIVGFDFKPNVGGMAEYTYQVARHLHLAGDNVMVLSKRIDGDKEFDSGCQYEVRRYDHDALLKLSRIRRNWRNWRAIKNAARAHSAEVIISNCLWSEPHICWLVSKFLGIGYGVFAHGLDVNPEVRLRAKMKRLLALRGADRVFCNSSFTRGILKNLGVLPGKTVILHPGISEDGFNLGLKRSDSPITQKLGLGGKKVVLTLGRLVERKGIDKTIQAMEIVRQKVSNVFYIVAGDGPYRETLQKLTKKLNLQDRIVFTGYVPETEKSSYYAAADVFAMPNRELENGDVEGFGIVFLEANAHGKPVIGGRSGGAVDAIVDGETGLLVNPIDVGQIASAILRLLKDEDYAKQLGNQGRKRVQREFDWEGIVSRMRGELKKLSLRS